MTRRRNRNSSSAVGMRSGATAKRSSTGGVGGGSSLTEPNLVPHQAIAVALLLRMGSSRFRGDDDAESDD
jgi:hypothetical protein